MRPWRLWSARTLLLFVGDVVCALGAYTTIVWLRRVIPLPGTHGFLPPDKAPLELFPWLAIPALAAVFGLYLLGTYDEPLQSLAGRGTFLMAAGVASGAVLVLHFLLGRAVPRTVLVLFVPTLAIVLRGWRTVAERLWPVGQRGVLVLGSGVDAEDAAAALTRGEIPGHFLQSWRSDLSDLSKPCSETPELTDVVRDVVFASNASEDRACLIALLERSLRGNFELWVLPGISEIVASRVTTRSLGDLPLVPVSTMVNSRLAKAHRRVFDLVSAGILAVLTAPALALISLAVSLESPGAPWVKQRRVGRNGRVFQVWKVRTMLKGAEDESGPVLAARNDSRTTRIGRFLRKARLDELPQIFQVLGGSMSLIGPRPERPEFVARYEVEIPAYRLRLWLKPGLTGLAQIMGAYATRPDIKLRYDLGYLFHWSPALDILILMRTAATILRGNGV